MHGRAGELVAEASFGVVVSHDGGCSARWICPAALGDLDDVAPAVRRGRDGALLVTTTRGLRVSHDGGCSFATADGTDDTWIAAIDVATTGEVWLATADGRKANDVLRSTDGGATFAPAGLRSATIWWRGVTVAPGRAARVYASGYEVAGAAPRAHVAISDDGGAHWAESALAGVAVAATPLVIVKAVDPGNADRVFASSLGAAPDGDRLYRSLDGGATWRDVGVTGAITDVSIAGDTVI
ncbi:MAG TPA: sialidase family protein, partial [Kofleriaceae bacterium]|nr:sialidase family protein [Kofleriaceae bacterium]